MSPNYASWSPPNLLALYSPGCHFVRLNQRIFSKKFHVYNLSGTLTKSDLKAEKGVSSVFKFISFFISLCFVVYFFFFNYYGMEVHFYLLKFENRENIMIVELFGSNYFALVVVE